VELRCIKITFPIKREALPETLDPIEVIAGIAGIAGIEIFLKSSQSPSL
jgi:hypothetical protein